MCWTSGLEFLDQSWGRRWNIWKLFERRSIQNLPWCMKELCRLLPLHQVQKPSRSSLSLSSPERPLPGTPGPGRHRAGFGGGSSGWILEVVLAYIGQPFGLGAHQPVVGSGEACLHPSLFCLAWNVWALWGCGAATNSHKCRMAPVFWDDFCLIYLVEQSVVHSSSICICGWGYCMPDVHTKTGIADTNTTLSI